MHTHNEIANELLVELVSEIEITVVDVISDIGEHEQSNDAFFNEVAEARDEILFTLVHKINMKYLNKYTQD